MRKRTLLMFGVIVAPSLLLVGCEEFLPPRIYPDPGAALDPTFSTISGIVFFEKNDSLTQTDGGSFLIEVKNLHDEFLSGPKDIQISIDFWQEARPGQIYHITGDRNNLLNQYDWQGDVFLLDGNILSLAPDSSARFRIGWDHAAYKLYEEAAPRFELYGCPTFAQCGGYIVTDSLFFRAEGSIKVWAAETTPKPLEEIPFTIFYFFDVDVTPVQIDNMASSVDSVTGAVTVTWTTFLHFGVDKYGIERAYANSIQFDQVGEVIAPRELYSDTLSFVFIDPDPPSGINRYRLGVWQVPPFFTRPLVAYYVAFPPVIVP